MTPDTSEKTRPLLLTEILVLLGSLLSTKELSRTSGVCKLWHRILFPKLWHTLRVGAGRKCGHTHKSEHLDRLERHIQLVRFLHIQMKGPSTMSEVDLKTRKEEGRLKATLVKCRRLTRIITDSLYSDLFEILGNNRGTMVSFELNPVVDEQHMLFGCLE